MTGANNLNGALNSSYANASASSSRVTLESRDDKRILRKPSRGKLLPWSRRGKKSASAEHVKGGSEEEIGFRDHPIYAERSLSTSPGGSEEALETQLERLMIPPPWPYENRPENCPSITSVPPYKAKTFYRLHAPAGPPYYINHHLRPPNSSALVAARSPASAFSNSFPPLAALPPGSPPLRTITLSLRAPPDQQHAPFQASQSSPDNVSLTPYSSTNIGFAGASDVSYFNRDNHSAVRNFSADVDHLDVSNPWGQKFHHDSPYDLGQKKGKKPIRPGGPLDSTSVTDLRSRLPSHSRFSRPTTPSPLSQSTPAVNMQLESKELFGPRRRLSKRKPSGLQTPLTIPPSPDSSSNSQHSTSSPIDRHVPESAVSMTSTAITRDVPSAQVPNSTPFPLEPSRKLSKRRPVQFPSTSGYIPSPEKNKGTGNVFGRMAKRFSFGMGSFMSGGKRGMTFERRVGHKGSMSLTDVTFSGRLNRPQNEPSMAMRNEPPQQAPQQEPQKQGLRRIPPPSLEELPASSVSVSQTTTSIRKSIVAPTPGLSAAPQLPNIVSDASFVLMSREFQEGAVRDSLVSTDAEPNWSLGKLTIANPDMVGGSDTDTSLRGKGKNLTSTSRPPPDGASMVDPDPRASVRVEVDSRSSFQDLGDRNSRAFTTESHTPTQGPASLQQQETQLSVPSPPPKEERTSVLINGTAATEALRVSVTESSVTTNSRPSSRVSSPDLPPTPQDATPPDFSPPPPISKNNEVPVPTETAQDGSLNTPIASDRLNLSNAAETPSSTKPRPNGRQERVYIVDVPVDGSLFVRSAPDGGSVPPVEKPELPPLPPKSEPQSVPVPPSVPSSRHSKDRKETTIFTTLFNTPRGRRTSESPPTEGSSHDHGSQISPSSARSRTKTSPDKSSSAVNMRTDSTQEREIHGERVKDRDYYGSRRGDRRSYLERRDDRDVNSRDVHRENRPRSEEAEQRERERERRREREERQTGAKDREKERQRQRLKEEEERAAKRRREREEEESRVNKAKEREEKARERDEEQRRLRRAKEREEEEGRLRRIKQKEEEERKAREDEERRARKAKEKEEEERRIRREKERAEEERRVRREREDEERKARKIREEEERKKAKEEEERKRAEEEKTKIERRRVEEERRRREEEEERRARREEEEKRRARKEEEERRAKKEEEEQRRMRREDEERRARKEEEHRRARKEEEDRRARKEEEDRRAMKEEETRRARKEEEDRRARKEEEDRQARREAQERSVRKQREKEELQRAVRKEKERSEAEKERELEREFMRQREWELEQRHQEEQSWSQETMRSLQSVSGDRPTTSVAGYSYPSIYSSTVGYDWEPIEPPHHRKQRSYDSHESGRQQVRNRKEPARLPDYNRRAELGIYPPGPSSHFRRPRAVSLESASQPPTPPRKEKEYTLRRQQINGHVYPSMPVDDTIFTHSRVPRPVSGFPSPDVLKAREAWEHDRIWRGQSMSFDTGTAVSGSVPTASWTDLRSYAYEPSIPSVSYYSPPPPGSSYTSFMVQPSWSYPHYQTSSPPAPIEPFSIPPSSNPLPPPPRQSKYQFQPPS